jgi:probable selenium-dependent hydroxylase accessory protein YqeC
MEPEAVLLDGNEETLAVVGAGGKKTTLYGLAARLDRAVVTSTVRIPPFADRVAELSVTDDPVAELDGADWPLGLAACDEGGRLRGYDPAIVDDLAANHDGPVLVKADGARTRWLKAPNDREPQLPGTVDAVVPIASARVVGEPLDEAHVHRPDRVAAVTGLDPGDEIDAAAVASVLASDSGGLKDVPDGARVVPLVNMADDDRLVGVARQIAAGVLDRAGGRIEGVAIARMDVPEIVDVRR